MSPEAESLVEAAESAARSVVESGELSATSGSALEDAAIKALRILHKVSDDVEPAFDIIAIMGMMEMIFAMIQQCQESRNRRRRSRSRQASDMLRAAQNPSRRVRFGAYRTARQNGNSRRESVELVDAWIEAAQRTTVESVEAMIEEVEDPLVA